MKNNVITTKVGLSYSLKQMVWWTPVDVDCFFPKCFDLTDGNELEDFRQEYRFQKAENLLKTYVDNPEGQQNALERLLVAFAVCEKRLKDVDD